MLVETPTLKGMAADRSQQVLEMVHRLLQAGPDDTWTVAELLGNLTTAFATDGAGLGAPLPGPLLTQHQTWQPGLLRTGTRFPWQEDPTLAEKVHQTPGALCIQGTDGSTWMVAEVWLPNGNGWLIWVASRENREWSLGEQASLPLAGHALARLISLREDGWAKILDKSRMQRQVESVATVTGRLAHDFGNVLTGILGFTELSLSQVPRESILHRYMGEVYQSAQQGAKWVHQLQLFTRKVVPHFRPARLELAAAEEETRARTNWGGRVALLLGIPEDLPPLGMDADSLRQALAQLLDNAREAIPEEGVVTLSARLTELSETHCADLIGYARPGAHVEITVTDTGTGLSPETRGRLFVETFYSTKKRHRGLGLAVVYGILQAFHAGLRFGPDPEHGTAVRLFVPVARETSQAAPEQTPKALKQARILVVDDDRVVLKAVAQTLTRAGYPVETAAGPTEARERFTATPRPFQLLLTDVVMPVMDGFQLANQLSMQDPRLKILFLTGQSPVMNPANPELPGNCGFLRKPFDPQALIRAVERALGNEKN